MKNELTAMFFLFDRDRVTDYRVGFWIDGEDITIRIEVDYGTYTDDILWSGKAKMLRGYLPTSIEHNVAYKILEAHLTGKQLEEAVICNKLQLI